MAFHSLSPRKMGREEENMKKQNQPWLVPWLCLFWALSPRTEQGEGFTGWWKDRMPGTCFSQDGRPGQNPGSFQLLWAHSWCLHCLSGDHHGWVMLRALSLLSPPSPPSLQHLPSLHQSLISFSLPIPLQIPCRCGSLTFFSFPVPTDHPPWWVQDRKSVV